MANGLLWSLASSILSGRVCEGGAEVLLWHPSGNKADVSRCRQHSCGGACGILAGRVTWCFSAVHTPKLNKLPETWAGIGVLEFSCWAGSSGNKAAALRWLCYFFCLLQHFFFHYGIKICYGGEGSFKATFNDTSTGRSSRDHGRFSTMWLAPILPHVFTDVFSCHSHLMLSFSITCTLIPVPRYQEALSMV